jgi:hypothetical protein
MGDKKMIKGPVIEDSPQIAAQRGILHGDNSRDGNEG